MSQIKQLLRELDNEAQTTRKMLSRVPADKFDWKPHQKSMSLRELTGHIAELPGWVPMVLTTEELDFAKQAYTPPQVSNTDEVLVLLEKSLENAKAQLESSEDADLDPEWLLRNGDIIYSRSSRGEFIRTTYCQIVHHRAQLGVYLRLLDIPIPGSYGPSADEN
ncbi:DinB family protein [Terrimonas ferruginea]|uniref:DinB family protein n=1 Tax=Terrimonas ferruginea TaxID=249 RepID=UPI0004291DBF|nr:DinB family protein [Terrimonas ferruginea]